MPKNEILLFSSGPDSAEVLALTKALRELEDDVRPRVVVITSDMPEKRAQAVNDAIADDVLVIGAGFHGSLFSQALNFEMRDVGWVLPEILSNQANAPSLRETFKASKYGMSKKLNSMQARSRR